MIYAVEQRRIPITAKCLLCIF